MKRITAILPVLMAIAACDTFYAEVEQPVACLTLPEQTYTFLLGPGPIVGPWEGDAAWNVDLGISGALPDKIVSGNTNQHVIQFLSFGATLASTPANASFDWLKSMTLTVETAGGTPVTVAQYAGGLPAGAKSFNLPSANTTYNLLTAMQNGQLQVTMRAHAAVPAGESIPATWRASVNACVSARVKYTLGDMTK